MSLNEKSASRLFIFGAGWPVNSPFIERRLRAIAKAGFQVFVIATRSINASGEIPNNGINVIFLPDPRCSSDWPSIFQACLLNVVVNPVRSIKLFWLVRRQASGLKSLIVLLSWAVTLARYKPDMLHFEWVSAAIDFEWAIDYFDCPAVISNRGRQVNILPHIPGNDSYTADLRRVFQKASAVHCVCEEIRKEAVELGMPSHKGIVIYTAIDPEFHHPEVNTRGPGPFRVVMVGGLIWRKGYEYALMAFQALLEKGVNAELYIIGSGPEKIRIEYTIQDLQIEGQVHLLGELDPTAVRDRLRQADILLHAGLSEGIANAVIEAMACGLPVVTVDCGGMREAVRDGIEGYLVPPRNPQAMADAIMSLAFQPDLRRQMGAAGRQRVLRQFTVDRQAEQFVELYHKLNDQ
jgi:colanic acid/amylovoran biosynthesis glycosyltransferase